ncbi:MAG: hypothetical protein FWG02_04640 [Holophagaceae bacterium]|nr:hypothetical protein [Holophagaceae bacterium]
MSLPSLILASFFPLFCQSQDFFQENLLIAINTQVPSVENYILHPKPWWLKVATKKWQWLAFDPKIYHPPNLNPQDYPAIIEHEKTHLSQQRERGKYRWFIKYVASRKFRLSQELEPIVVELSCTPVELRRQLAIKYAKNLSESPYHRAAKSFEIAYNSILSKAEEMGVEIDI